MKRLAAGFGLLLVTALPAHAASFDCSRAASIVEKAICAQPQLSKADEELSRAYNQFLVVYGDNDSLAQEEKTWLEKRDATQVQDLLALHQDRIAELQRRLKEATRPVDHASLNATCVPVASAPREGKCSVEGFGTIKNDALSWQTQSYDTGDGMPQHASVVLQGVDGQPGMDSLLAAHFTASGYVDEPTIVSNRFGRFLSLSGMADGTAHFNEGVLLVQDKDAWRMVDATSWETPFSKRLKGTLYTAKGIFPDFAKMTAETPLWQEGDPDCCATGGYARVRLGYKNQRITFEDVQVTLGKKAASGE